MEINLTCALCDQAALDRQAAAERELNQPPAADNCAFCIAYHQAGGCKEVCAEISTRVAEKDWDAARAIANAFIARLEALEVSGTG